MMLDELQRRNYSEHTTRYYIRTVEDFARRFNRPPDRLGPRHVREYQAELFLKRKLSPGSVAVRLAALRFFYGKTLKKSWSIAEGPRKGQPLILDNMAKRSIVLVLNRCAVCKETESAEHKGLEYQRDETLPRWHGWRRFVATEVRMQADSETSAKALGNSKAVADKHYINPHTVLPGVRKAVNDAFSGLIQ
jgi:hypothetical protein